MSEVVSFTAEYQKVEGGWVQARLVEVPGVITAAPTKERARELLADALREYFLSFTEEPSAVEPPGSATHATVEVVIKAG